MKRLMFAILSLPFIAGCWGKDKKDVVTESNFDKTEELIGADKEMSEGMTPENLPSSEDEK